MSKRHQKRAASRRPLQAVKANALAVATAFHQAGRLREAAEAYDEAIVEEPRNVQAIQLSGIVAFQLGDFGRAEAAFRRVLTVAPDNPEAYNNLGNVLRRRGQIGKAIEYFQQALERNPTLANAHGNLGSALVCRGKLREAVSHMERAIELEPNLAQPWLDIVAPLAHMGRFNEALEAFKRAAELQPDLIAAFGSHVYAQLAAAFAARSRDEEAVACLEQSVALQTGPADGNESLAIAYNTLGLGCQHNGRLPEAMKWFEKAMAAQPDRPTSYSSSFWCLQYDDRHSPAFARDRAIEWARRFAPQSLARNPRTLPADSRRLRVGYLSPELREHPVAYCMESMLEAHDRSKFEIFLYANTMECDQASRRLERRADHWRNLIDLSDDEAADAIETDRLDILVDLAGHTENNRIGVFARKPAPIQAEWLGYYATTGLPQIDYFICNPALIPPDEEELYVEKPMRLEGKAFSFKPPTDKTEVPPLPALASGSITFGCHNYLAKVTPEVVRVWAEVLRAVPGSRFVMNRQAFIHPNVREYFAAMFEANGIDRSRIEFQCTSSRSEYLESLGKLDVLLDTFPFNGATSIYEALWMGLPVVSMSAPRMVGHFAASILGPLGHGDWVADDAEGYVARARGLVADLPALAALRASLRELFVQSPLCDARAFTRDIEAAFVRMHEEKLRSAGASG